MRVFKTKSELQELASLDKFDEPRLLIIKSALKQCIEERIPETSMEVIVDDYPTIKSLIVIMWSKFTKPFVSFYLINGGTLNDLDALLEQAFGTLPALDEFILFGTEVTISVHLQSTVLASKFDFSAPVASMYEYYMPTEQYEEVSKLQLELPHGFRFVDLHTENDAPLISGTWPCARDGDIFNTQAKLTHLPSVGVKFENHLAAFEILHQTGVLHHLYTLPEFRGKGLAKAAELKLCQKLIDIGICPFKKILVTNSVAVSMADTSPYWAKVLNGNEPAVVDYRHIRAK